MLSVEELNKITKLLNKAHKHQLLTLIQHIELFPLKNKMSSEEYVQYINEPRLSGITRHMLKKKTCKYCKSGQDVWIKTEATNEIYLSKEKITAFCGWCGSKTKVKINFCPMCGRKLGEDKC